jgi:hypothetical protein
MSMAMIDRAWPHQVALPAYRCHGHNYVTMRLFCEPLSLNPRTHSFRRDNADMIVFSFAKHAHAEKFQNRFGGELIAPPPRTPWLAPLTSPTGFSLADHQPNGRCINCAD